MIRIVCLLSALICANGVLAADYPLIMVSIKPFYNISAKVMQSVGKPELLIKNNASPHDYQLKPSDAQIISSADLIIWGGSNLEAYLAKPVASLAKRNLNLEQAPGIKLLPVRNNHDWQCDHDHSHDHGDFDPHFWLDPENAIIVATAIAEELSMIDPKNASIYSKNANDFAKEIRKNEVSWKKKLAPFKDKPYIVAHDAYQYFNTYFSLDGVGSVTINPEMPPSAKHIQDLQEMLHEDNITCIFTEPQFSYKIIDTLIAGTEVHKGILDPLGQDSDLGPNGYFMLMNNLVNNFVSCNALK